ncbi:hypothetical protein MHU86_19339 [Fragilaria crotonensis]|nr:hypothetical protein MHU86_19339 [Fragilaria crotonensis]
MDSCNTSPPAGTRTADCPTAPAAIEKSKRGPAFTSAEDLIVARAFIAASENAICGAHQKGKVFKLHMFELYKELIDEQNKANQALLEQSSHGTREEYLKQGVGLSFSHRSAESIFNRFKSQISTEVMKYMGITETTEMASGWSLDDHKIACLELYKQRYGNVFDFYPCYEYLKGKNKFSAFRTKCEEESLGKRPIGKKKARQAEADAKLVKAIISEVVVKKEKKGGRATDSVVSAYESSGESGGANTHSSTGGVMGDVLQNISNVIANVGTALLENMKAEQDMRFVQSLDTPDRKMYAKEQLALRLAETRDKRRRIELSRSSITEQQQANEWQTTENEEHV